MRSSIRSPVGRRSSSVPSSPAPRCCAGHPAVTATRWWCCPGSWPTTARRSVLRHFVGPSGTGPTAGGSVATWADRARSSRAWNGAWSSGWRPPRAAGQHARLEPGRHVRPGAGPAAPEAVRQVVTLGSPFRSDGPIGSARRQGFNRLAHLHVPLSQLPPPEADRDPADHAGERAVYTKGRRDRVVAELPAGRRPEQRERGGAGQPLRARAQPRGPVGGGRPVGPGRPGDWRTVSPLRPSCGTSTAEAGSGRHGC